jgi:uncharacterized protein (DUF433 family)
MGTMTTTVIGRGIYDPTEVARLVRVHPDTITRWTTGKRALVAPSFDGFFDFEDLVSLLVVAQLWRRHVPTDEIRRGIEGLAQELGVERPLAHEEAPERLATVGKAFFANVGEWADVGKGFQLAFMPMIAPVLKPLEYGNDGMANLWRPLNQVTAAPAVQAGTPCVEGTRIPTATIDGLVRVDEEIDDIAFDFDIEVEQIKAALAFEEALRDRLLSDSVLVG